MSALRFLYNLLFPFAFALILPGYLRRMVRRGDYRQNFGQRLGWYSSDTQARLARQGGAVWMHAVSVGEMLVALKLLAALRAQDPELSVVLSTTTTTGRALADTRAPRDVEVVYTPVDLSGAVRRAFNAIRPTQLVVVDGGIWPNQLWEARRRGVPTALVNARLSPRSERRFRRLPRLAAALYGLLDLVCVTEKNDLPRWEGLGIVASKIRHCGSVKFDDARSPTRLSSNVPLERSDWRSLLGSLGIPATAPILLAGSTHPGEEYTVAEVFLRLRNRFPDLLLIVAPRHAERTPEVETELAAMGLQTVLRSKIEYTTLASETPTTLIIDTTGELRDWYPAATLVFIGKSLHALGGQNPAEAIAAGVPVIFGPHMENFAELTAQLLAARAAVQIASPEVLEAKCAELLSDSEERHRLTTAAREQIANHRGAAARTASLLLEQLRNSACQGG